MALVASLEAWECNLSSCFRSLLHAVYWTRHTSTICMIRRPSEAINDHKTPDSGAALVSLFFFNRAVFKCRGNWKIKISVCDLWNKKNWLLRFCLEKSWCRWVLEFQYGCTRTHLVQKHSLVLQLPLSASHWFIFLYLPKLTLNC